MKPSFEAEFLKGSDVVGQSDENKALEIPIVVTSTELPLDLDTALPRFFNDRSFFLEMLHDLVSHMPERMQEINMAMEKNNSVDLYRFAHNMKGVSSNFSAGPVSKLAAQIEALGKSEDVSGAVPLVSQMEIEIERLRQYCKAEFGIE